MSDLVRYNNTHCKDLKRNDAGMRNSMVIGENDLFVSSVYSILSLLVGPNIKL